MSHLPHEELPAGRAFADEDSAPAGGAAPAPEAEPGDLRICVLGDDLVAGVGDPKALGWVGRVAARTPSAPGALSVFAIGVPGESTSDLLGRWREETGRRFAGAGQRRIVLGLGHADLVQQVSLARSRLNLANVLDEAAARRMPAFVVGPPPTQDAALNDRVAELADAFADVCQRRHVTFVDTFGALASHEAWYSDLASGDGVHPGQAGYGLIAWLVLHGGWHSWLGVPTD